jgi:hypothetical protein
MTHSQGHTDKDENRMRTKKFEKYKRKKLHIEKKICKNKYDKKHVSLSHTME